MRWIRPVSFWRWGILFGLCAVLAGCGGGGRVGPHEAYKNRQGTPQGAWGEREPGAPIRIAALAFPAGFPKAEAGALLRILLSEGRIDILFLQGIEEESLETIGSTGTALGLPCAEGQNGLGALSRARVMSREGRSPDYPYDSFLIQFPNRDLLWGTVADTAIGKPEEIPRSVQRLVANAESHAEPVVAAIAFRSDSTEAEAEAREILSAGGFALVARAGSVELRAAAAAHARLTPFALPPSVIDAARGKVDIVAADYAMLRD